MHQKYGATAYIPAGASSATEMTTLASSSSKIEILYILIDFEVPYLEFGAPYLDIPRFYENMLVARRPHDQFPGGVASRSLLCVRKQPIPFLYVMSIFNIMYVFMEGDP